MRHYEIVLLIHPDQSEQVPSMLERYRHTVENQKGQVHRLESCGRRQLAYQIKKVHKAHFAVLNIECEQSVLQELDHAFRFNDAILRYLIVKQNQAITKASPLMKEEGPTPEAATQNRTKEKIHEKPSSETIEVSKDSDASLIDANEEEM